jgi:hypothetical protein
MSVVSFIFEDLPENTNTDLWWLRIILKTGCCPLLQNRLIYADIFAGGCPLFLGVAP